LLDLVSCAWVTPLCSQLAMLSKHALHMHPANAV